jgi:hypothetical protein
MKTRRPQQARACCGLLALDIVLPGLTQLPQKVLDIFLFRE